MAITFNNTLEVTQDWFARTAYTSWMHIFRKVNGVFSSDLYNSNNYDYFDDAAIVGDCIYFGVEWIKWSELILNIGTVMAGADITFEWEYHIGTYNVDTWSSLAGLSDGTGGFTNAGVQSVTWTMPVDWSEAYINTKYGYFIRARITGLTSITEGGAQQTDYTKIKDYTITVDGVGNTLSDIYDADVAGNWNVITRDSISKQYLVICNLQLNGELAVKDGEGLTVGKEAGKSNDHACFILSDQSGQTKLELGEKANNKGYNGGRVTYNSGINYQSPYNRWYGELNIYGSILELNTDLSMRFCEMRLTIEWLDSIIYSTYGVPILYFGTNTTGTISRCLISFEDTYLYYDKISFVDAQFNDTPDGGNPNRFVFGARGIIEGTNFDGFTIGAYAYYNNTCHCRDCLNVEDNYQVDGAYINDDPAQLYDEFTFQLKVVDTNGNAIDGATIIIRDIDGNSALFEEMTNYDSNIKIDDVDTVSDTVADLGDNSYFAVNDKIMGKMEIMKIISKDGGGTDVTISRGETGTVETILHTSATNTGDIYRRLESVLTDSNGELKYNTTYDFVLFRKMWYEALNISETSKTFEPFTLIIKKQGYMTYKIPFFITESTNWKITLFKSPYTKILGVN